MARVGMVRVVVGTEVADLISERLWQAGASAVEERPAGDDQVELLADADASLLSDLAVELVEVDADATLEAQRRSAQPWSVADVRVRPPWVDASGEGGLDVVIDPGHAFGDGSHPTTRLCTAWTRQSVREGSSFLDVGCGSGVLAVVAALSGARPIAAVDVSLAARSATAANAEANRVQIGIGPDLPDRRFDLVVANIGLLVLREIAPEVIARVAPGGRLVTSGLLVSQVDAIRIAYAALSFERAVDEDGWAAVVFSRPVTVT